MGYKFFTEDELICKCGCGSGEMDNNFMKKLIVAREKAKIPFMLSSAFRCESHNRDVNGHRYSFHRKGMAVDIICTNSQDRQTIIKALLDAGFTHIGIAKDFIHVDAWSKEAIYLY